jgi:NAD(P)-dependent dehydrogenase (short-subunit alcohol dehydrogenase family)
VRRAYRTGALARGIPGATSVDRRDAVSVTAHHTDRCPVTIVTGGSWGPGSELASRLAGRGHAIVVIYLRNQGDAEAVVEAILTANGTALAVRADLTDELDVERIFDETLAAFGAVDVVAHASRRDASTLYRQAARRLTPGGAIVSLSGAELIAPATAQVLRARDITVNGLGAGLESPGPAHDVTELLALLDRWRPAREG